ncbi:Bgt-4498 [Blumeria graminis f. sp. tritici]|uniref:Bgt-4498 n=2 Tax=Blumeria graminis f. sp. tritici TaxID=62690 RepID=A0A061HRZ0_BLUGR|nr:hypothetical protein BGT96224_4498 [Blumeria graminis f. sp. tritici 96224]VCU39106.1 Bgt-4498 [Blumeria graminis f. sp. tritici]
MATSDNTKPTIPAKDSLEQDKSIQSKNRYQNNKSEGDSAQEIAQVTPNTPNVSEYTVTESKDGNEILQDEIADQLKHETVDKKIDNQPYPVELSVERNQENHLIINTDEQINFTEDLDGSYHEICENNIEIKSVKSEESQSKSLNVAPLVSRRQENESSKAQNDSVIHRISKTSLAGEKSSINENIGQINNHSTITSVSLENVVTDPKLSSSETANDTLASRTRNLSITENITLGTSDEHSKFNIKSLTYYVVGIRTTEDGKYPESLNSSKITTDYPLRSASISTDQAENPTVPPWRESNSQQNCDSRNFKNLDAPSRSPNDAGNNLPTFKEILALNNAKDRIKTFNHNRKAYASIDSGLEEWAQQVKKMYPEYEDVTASFDGPEPRISGGFGSTRAIFAKVTGSQPFLPSGYHQRQQSGLQPTPTTPNFRHSMMPAMQSTPQVSVSTNRLKSHQVQTKGKELLHTAGVFGGKAGRVGKDFLAKGKNRLRSAGAGDHKTE